MNVHSGTRLFPSVPVLRWPDCTDAKKDGQDVNPACPQLESLFSPD